jgi:uncharacterized Ntn-hydrolase superfamily protein
MRNSIRRIVGLIGLCPVLLLLGFTPVRATFSIVAVDTATGEVGGAGASCIPGSRIINDLIQGVGAIHTQALYTLGNQNYAHELMEMGFPPQQIIDSLEANDFSGNPTIRQYGVVDLFEGGRSAAFTGENCTDWAGHLTGPNYAIQGNILLGSEIIDSMEYAFTHAEGMLSDKLMAAVLAARVPGADTRCLGRGTSAISAFVRVVRIGDNPAEPYCYLNVNNTTGNTEPLDLLEEDYEEWLTEMSSSADEYLSSVVVARDSVAADGMDTTAILITLRNNQGEFLGEDATLAVWTSRQSVVSNAEYQGDGVYRSILTAPNTAGPDTITVFSLGGIRQREMRDRPVVQFVESSPAMPTPAALPDQYELSVYPNPFNSSTTIRFSLPSAQQIRLRVHDLGGRLVKELTDRRFSHGSHSIDFIAETLPSGIYFVFLQGQDMRIARKVVFLK